jgi:hypothetical protein
VNAGAQARDDPNAERQRADVSTYGGRQRSPDGGPQHDHAQVAEPPRQGRTRESGSVPDQPVHDPAQGATQ